MIKVVLPDADGVVIKNHEYFSVRYKRDFGDNLNEDAVINFFRTEYKDTAVGKADLKKLLEGRLENWGWQGAVEELLNYWFEGERELDDKVLEFVSESRSKGIKVCLVSDNEKYRAKYLINEVGLGDKFDEVFFSCDLGFTKSDPEFFQNVIEKLGVKTGEVIYFDDDAKNVEVAKSVGISSFVYGSIADLDSVTI